MTYTINYDNLTISTQRFGAYPIRRVIVTHQGQWATYEPRPGLIMSQRITVAEWVRLSMVSAANDDDYEAPYDERDYCMVAGVDR